MNGKQFGSQMRPKLCGASSESKWFAKLIKDQRSIKFATSGQRVNTFAQRVDPDKKVLIDMIWVNTSRNFIDKTKSSMFRATRTLLAKHPDPKVF